MKTEGIQQLTLGVSVRDEATFASFLPGSNALLQQELLRAARGKGERIIYLFGAPASGRSHLLQASCHAACHGGRSASYLPLAGMKHIPVAMFEGLENRDLVCVDDLHLIAGQPVLEEAFFHAFNHVHDAGGSLVMSADMPPATAGFRLPDLVSRLCWGMVFQLHALSDHEKLEMLVLRAAQRGMQLPEEVGRFILRHCPRHVSTLCAALDVLDRTSLAAQRRLTIPFVKSVLEI